ncbi:zinc finger protein 236-like [Tubulanus polymorphus]|uniref:zinc finger protein 236-like n=1 Tax=Tubulanus polymorphus TaxID=672921 RepID=UPI003DA656D9
MSLKNDEENVVNGQTVTEFTIIQHEDGSAQNVIQYQTIGQDGTLQTITVPTSSVPGLAMDTNQGIVQIMEQGLPGQPGEQQAIIQNVVFTVDPISGQTVIHNLDPGAEQVVQTVDPSLLQNLVGVSMEQLQAALVGGQQATITTENIVQQENIPPALEAKAEVKLEKSHMREVVKPVGKGPFPCDYCRKEFPKWTQLQRHIKTHDDDKPYNCPDCDASFNVEQNLVLHMATHDPDNPVCPECGKRFSRVASLKAHLMVHEREEILTCPECGDEFISKNQLERHMNDHKQANECPRTYNCKHCSQIFNKLVELREHVKQHQKVKSSISHRCYRRNIDRSKFPYLCKNCNKSFLKPSQLERHIRIHTGERPFKCTQCSRAFNQKGALQIHMSNHTGVKPHSCTFCPAKFAQKGNLRAHILRVHTPGKDGQPYTFTCEQCSCVFKKLGSLNAHIGRAHFNEPDQVQSGLSSNTDPQKTSGDNKMNEVIKQLLQLSENTNPSSQAIHPSDSSTNLDVHAALALGAQSDFDNSDILQQAMENSGVQIDNIQQAAKQVAKRVAAVPRAVRIAPDESEPTDAASNATLLAGTTTVGVHDAATGQLRRHIIRKVNGVRWHQCTYCSKEFKKPSDLVRHIRIHTHERPYKCSQCFRSFAVKSTLSGHMKTHSGIKDFRCYVCDKMFATHGSLKVHARLHTGSKPFDCPHCDKRFRTSGHRKTHVQSHFKAKESHSSRPRRFVRRASKAELPLSDVPLQEPILITDTGWIQQPARNTSFNQYLGETSSVDRPYKCSYCSRGFKKSSHLKQHVRSHTGERPYKCVTCLRSFVSSGVLKAHIRTHTGVKNHKCLICDSQFTTNGSLKRHMSTHSEVRPFMCPYCQKTFKTSVNCKKHMKTHRHELAMQALSQQSGETSITGVTEEIAATNHLTSNQQQIVIEEQPSLTDSQVYTTTQSLVDPQNADDISGIADIDDVVDDHVDNDETNQQSQQVVLQDRTLTSQITEINSSTLEQQLQQTLNQQIFAQTLNQNILGGQQITFGNNSFTIQGNSIDMQSLSSINLSQAQPQMQTIGINNILNTRTDVTSQQDPEPDQNQQDPTFKLDMESGRKSYRCTYCDKDFKKTSHLKQHIRSHTGERPYKCNECGKMFVSSGVLKAHSRTHRGIKDHKCHMCEATFTTNGSLTRHMAIHTSETPFKCPICDESFRTSVLCKRHVKLHEVDEAPAADSAVEQLVNIPLEQADDQQQKSVKRSHINVLVIPEGESDKLSKLSNINNTELSLSERILIESAVEKNKLSLPKNVEEQDYDEESKHAHKCEQCPKSFKKPSDLVRHKRIHSGEKPFICEICQRAFTVKSTLDCHFKTHTGAEKMFKCHVCSSLFSTKGSLKVHMRLHTGAKPFKCPHCDVTFRTSGHRKSHIAQHFKPATAKKRRVPARDFETLHQMSLMVPGTENEEQSANTGNQVIHLDSNALQQGGVIPLSFSITDNMGNTLNDASVAAQVLQGLEGVQLQLPGNIAQGIQITNILQDTLQVDPNLLHQIQQLQQQQQQQGTIAQGIQVSNSIQTVPTTASMTEAVNPNIIVQQTALSNLNAAAAEGTAVPVTMLPDIQTAPVADLMQTKPFIVRVDQNQQHQTHLSEHIAASGSDLTGLTDVQANPVSVIGDNQTTLTNTQQNLISNLTNIPTVINIQADMSHVMDGTVSDVGVVPELEDEQSHVCHECHKEFKRVCQLKDHVKQCHGISDIGQTNTDNSSVSKNLPHQCNICGKAFAKPSMLERHRRIHTGERPFVCNICNKAFNQTNALQIHYKKHTGEKNYKCPYCDASFVQKGNLKTHIRRAHNAAMIQAINEGKDATERASTAQIGIPPGSMEPTAEGTAETVESLDIENVVSDFFQS